MSNHQKEILTMLAEKKIDVEEAQKLLATLEKTPLKKSNYEFFNIVVEHEDQKKDQVNIKVPFKLLKTGIKWMGLVPIKAMDQIKSKMAEEGIDFDLNQLNSNNVDEVLESLKEFEVSANGKDSVRIYCS